MQDRFLYLVETSIQKNWDMPVYSDYNQPPFYFRDVARKIGKFHIFLQQLGVKRGDRIGIVGRNSSYWAIAFFGTLSYGAVVVSILHDFKPDTVHHIVNHSGAKLLLTGDTVWENLDVEQMPELLGLFQLNAVFSEQSINDNHYPKLKLVNKLFAKKYPRFTSKDVKYHLESPEELAVINYTSGTTSMSKGVMIPYRSLWSNVLYARDMLTYIKPGDRFVCMLPMAHMYGLAFEILNAFCKGCHVHFLTRTPSPQIISEAFARIKPVLILAVPLILEKIVKNKIFPLLEKPMMRFLLKMPLVNSGIYSMVRKKMVEAFGGTFGEVVLGGAALNPEIENFLRKIDFPYTVGYGMTECGPLIAYTPWQGFKQGSVGRVVDRMELRLDNPNSVGVGELEVRGVNTMLGYYKNPEATAAVMLPDGWMKTGDLCEIDDDGFITIKGRCKTMILGASGQNIYPEEMEAMINNQDYVMESLVIDKNGKLVAYIVPDWTALDRINETPAMVESRMKAMIVELNKSFPAYSQIKDLKLFQEEFDKTPKRSIRRFLYQ